MDSSSFQWWESYSFQEILIRCTFIIEDVPQSPFVDLLNFGSVSFSAVVPDLVTIVKIRQYKCVIKRFLDFKWQNVLQSVQSTYLSTYFATNTWNTLTSQAVVSPGGRESKKPLQPTKHTSLWEANGDVMLDGVIFSPLDWLYWVCTNPYNLAIVNLGPLNDYTSTPEQEVGILSLGWGVLFYLFIYLFIYSYKYYILLYTFYITTSYIRLQLIYIQFEKKIHTVEPPFNKPLYNKVLSKTNYFLQPSQKLQENVWNRTSL